MTPGELVSAARQIGERWPDALIYPNIAGRNDGVPDNALAVDVDRVWPHDCDDDMDCTGCAGEYRLVAWIDVMGVIHEAPLVFPPGVREAEWHGHKVTLHASDPANDE